MHRTSRLFAVGGGVVGDIGGLAAALYMRGISCVQVPTTLLAQADSGVGGKTAVDLGGVKNVVGAFYQPCEVIVDPMFLSTLPPREIKCGLGELVKYAALDGGIFELLKANADKLSEREFLFSLILPSVKHKAKVVEEDEKETGERKSLNVGHTTGHAVELSSSPFPRGKRALGNVVRNEAGAKIRRLRSRIREGTRRIGDKALNAAPRSAADFSRIGKDAEKARSDKKNLDDGNICISAAKSRGKWTLLSLPFEEYKQGLEEIARNVENTKYEDEYEGN